MAETIYLLCAVMSTVCALALYNGFRKTQNRLLLWSAGCFALLALNNIFLCVDLICFPKVDLHGPFWRALMTAGAGSTLLFGLIWELS
jgi:hypothetical protein